MALKLNYVRTGEIVDNQTREVKEVHYLERADKPEIIKQREEAEKQYTSLLKQEREAQEIESYKENEINWIKGDFFDSWDKVKGHCKKLLGHHESYDVDDEIEPFQKIFLAHSKDTIQGKPQLVDQTQKTIPLIREMVIKIKDEDDKDKKKKLFKYMFLDEKVDKRTDGYQRDIFSMDFRMYRVVDKDDKEYFILSKEILPNCSCTFNGMKIDLDDLAEMSRNLKLKSISKLFILKDYIPSVKILTPEQLVEFTKSRGINENDWKNILDYHPIGDFNRFPEEVNLLRSAVVLSGKKDGIPLHLFAMGPPGTGKSMGYLETTSHKFSDSQNILEGGNSRIKMLVPSFKEKPANLGYLAKCERIGFIDEVGKMVEFENNRHDMNTNNILGECNFLLDNNERLVGSGNDNECKVQANAKFIWVTNPVKGNPTIYSHIGLIDPTFLSRCFIWVQDKDEQNFIHEGKGIERFPPTPQELYTLKNLDVTNKNNKNINGIFLYVGGKLDSRDEFLTLFDTCYSFNSIIEESKISSLVNYITQLAREPMKTSIWKPRAMHHVFLLVDGLVKHRCLFKDYDASFIAKEEDYQQADKILTRMVKSWDTDLSPKQEGLR